jgi:hypothetical protein
MSRRVWGKSSIRGTDRIEDPHMSPAKYFPATYREGRAAFIKAADKNGMDITTRVHPAIKGPHGRPLFMDVACAGDRAARRALMLISGTHGVEGYFGSGVQTGLLREGLAKRLPKGVKLVMLHALNPFGFAWDRRVNEDNADINRNFVDYRKLPANPAYDALAPFIAPKEISDEAMKAANRKLVEYAHAHGPFALQTAISAGQYSHADGVYYGGQRESWSSAMLKDVIGEHLRGISKLVAIDYHTGLGDCGAAEMITEDRPGSPAYRRQTAIWGGRIKSNEAGESVSAPLTGTIDKAMAKWMSKAELTFAALEVGTAPMRDVFNALRKDNWLHLQKKPEKSLWAGIKGEIRAAFYPDSESWKDKVWDHAVATADPALAALA